MGLPIRAVLPFPHRPLVSALLLTCLALLVACGGEPDAPAETTPRSVQRVVSLVPALTETVVALGRADRLVAIGDFDPEVPGRPDLPRVGNAATLSVETVVALEPDLVLVNSAQAISSLAPVADRIRVERFHNDRLPQVFDTLDRLGSELDAEPRARELQAELRAALDAAGERARARSRSPRVAVVVQRSPLYVAGGASFVDDLLRAVGAQNAMGDLDQAWPSISEETLVARAPDVILDSSLQNVTGPTAEDALRASWADLHTVPAVRAGRVVLVRENHLFRPGPSLVEALDQLEGWLYPEESR